MSMAPYLFIITLWFGSASLQHIATSGAASDSTLNEDFLRYQPLPYTSAFNLPTARNEYETFQNDANAEQMQYYQQDQSDVQRKRRKVEDERLDDVGDSRWEANTDIADRTIYLRNDDKPTSTFIENNFGTDDDNSSGINMLNYIEKRSFSPWGGKREDRTNAEHMWSWKRSTSLREPSMPKRVRFSPWGGKRSGQMIYKPGSKSSKVIFSASVPELTRIVSSYLPNNERLSLTEFQFIPSVDKRHPIKLMALSTKLDDRFLRDELPFKTFIQSLPRIFKPGHTYSEINLKKDGKRKVKFSAWGGKRSPPIIGPIWTPAPQDVKESILDSILLIRERQDNENKAL